MLSRMSVITDLLPEQIRHGVDKFQSFVSTGIWREPQQILRWWRHRDGLRQLDRALFYHRYASALLLAVRLGVLDKLREATKTSEQLAYACGVEEVPINNLCLILEAEGVLVSQKKGWELSSFSTMALCETGPMSFGHLIELMAAQASAFAELPQCFTDGEGPKGLDIYAANGMHKAFLSAVNGYLYWATREFLDRADLPTINSFIVGSMGVSFSSVLMERNPQANVTYGCLPHLMAEVPDLQRLYGVSTDRVLESHSHGGDPAQDRWGSESFDLVFLTRKMILSPDEELGKKFATKALEVLRPGGVAVFWEVALPDNRRAELGQALEAYYDLVASPMAPLRTASDYREMLCSIGYRRVEVIRCLAGQTTFVVAYA